MRNVARFKELKPVGRAPLASVIVPVYNTSGRLEPCVDSLLGQTYHNLQIILVDDGSTDGCGEICDAFARRDPRVQVIHQENSGVSSARNAGLDAARGDYIYFVDSDDRVTETVVEESAAVMEAEDCDLCGWRMLIEDEQDASESRHSGCPKKLSLRFSTAREKQKFLSRWVLNNRLGWSACCRVFRRDLIERHRLRFLEGQKIYEDVDFLFRYTAFCRTFRNIPKLFYIYRQHSSSTMHTSVLQEQVAWKLRLIRSWESTLGDQALFQPLAAFSGIFLSSVLAKGLPRTTAEKRERAGILDRFLMGEDRDWLLEQAQAAVEDRAEILKICGLPLGLRVCGFYKSLLTGNVSDFYRAFRPQAYCAALLELERSLVSAVGNMLR